MKPEDLGGFLEEALNKVEPKDDAQREKLQRLRERLSASNEELGKELAKIKAQTAELIRPQKEGLLAEAAERLDREKSFAAGVNAAMKEQTELLQRIVAATHARPSPQ